MLKYKFFLPLFLLSIPLQGEPPQPMEPAAAPAPVEKTASPEPTPNGQPPAPIPAESSEVTVHYENAFIKMLLTLLGLLAFIFLTVWLLRRLSQGRLKSMNLSRGIKILERRPLSAKSTLYLLEVRGKQVLIAESQLDVRTLATIEEAPLSEET